MQDSKIKQGSEKVPEESREVQVVEIRTEDLHFDTKNPRLAEFDEESHSSEDNLLSTLWMAMDVEELVQSIAANGFFKHEPLIVVNEDDRFVVIEGNRRLAAVKVLLLGQLPQGCSGQLPTLDDPKRKTLLKLPTLQMSREEAWRYLGFKHVNGPVKWSGYAKAQYIANVHHDYGISLSDIAKQIGDRNLTVQRLYRGFMAMKQAEQAKVYDFEDRYNKRLAFSHLYTGLGYDGIGNFVAVCPLDKESQTPIPKTHLKQLGELCTWLYGSRRGKTPPVVISQNPNLRELNEVLESREALSYLREKGKLELALEVSRPAAMVFEQSLITAKRSLQDAQSRLTEGYDGTAPLLNMAKIIVNMANDLQTSMQHKAQRAKVEF
ncbi:MAG: ParB/RepB/Spo0J family partition protein [Planctomycetes bacterium]|nr:ParB/RepB/Spo0J family partition protein [Planctomycetota bacterium]